MFKRNQNKIIPAQEIEVEVDNVYSILTTRNYYWRGNRRRNGKGRRT